MTEPRVHVAVGGQPAGLLEADRSGRHVFAYHADCPPERFVSLTMPVRLDAYRWHELHPAFQTGLPEGAWGGWLREQLELAGRSTPLDLLLVSGIGPGRLSVSADGAAPATPTDDWREVLAARDSRTALRAKLEVSLDGRGFDSRGAPSLPREVRDAFALYRASPERAPHLATVEAWCLRIARRAGIEVVATELSNDRRTLRLTRSDGPVQSRLGRDDGCTLQGLGSADRYAGDPLRLVSALAAFVAPVSRTAVRREIFRRLLLSARLGDRTLELRRFALQYETIDGVRLGPLDALATTELEPGRPGLMPLLPGRDARRGTWRRFAAHCALALREAEAILEWQARAEREETAALEREIAGQAEDERLLANLKAVWAAGAAELARHW